MGFKGGGTRTARAAVQKLGCVKLNLLMNV